MSQAEELCSNCGAPRVAGYAACKYCKTPFASVKDTQTDAIPCPRCNTLNELGAQKCVQCQAWVVVQCVFCHALSPHNVPACTKCGEAFAGAPQRFAERQRAQQLQTGLEIAGTVGNVAYMDGIRYRSLDPTKVAHTFTVPQLGLNVPLPGDLPSGQKISTVTFTFITGKAGTYMWQCMDPCGSGSGWEGPMATMGYMMGTMTIK